MRCGISGVSAAIALKNLEAELPGLGLRRHARKAKAAWQRELTRIQIEARRPTSGHLLHLALPLMCAPTYGRRQRRIPRHGQQDHTLDPGQHNYTTFSLWDTFRALHPLYTLFLPERVPSMVNCLVAMAEQSPAGMPVWPLQGTETGTMTGYHSASVMAEACVKTSRTSTGIAPTKR